MDGEAVDAKGRVDAGKGRGALKRDGCGGKGGVGVLLRIENDGVRDAAAGDVTGKVGFRLSFCRFNWSNKSAR